MLDEASIRQLARERGVRTDYAEKDYVNSWVLYGIYTTDLGDSLLFKGGTALSKLYFPAAWRFSEKIRTIYQRSRGRDYFDLYQIVVGDGTPPPETVASIYAEKRDHAPDESYHTSPEPDRGLPLGAQGTIADDWETTVPELVADTPALETVRERLDAYLVNTLAPALNE